MTTGFTSLIAWQKAQELVIEIYQHTKSFPKDEQFGLTNQIRRAAVSITSNIAEGYGRSGDKEKTQFFSIALGSLSEVESQIFIARDLHYLSTNESEKIITQTTEVGKIIHGLISRYKK
jgi:four helix bundle protein